MYIWNQVNYTKNHCAHVGTSSPYHQVCIRRCHVLIINAHPPPSDSSLRNEFILLIPNNRHSSFLWHNLDRANPLTMWHMINNPSVQKLKDIFLNNLSHSIVKSPLWLP
jgi:hypothetical protein